ncbi:MAG: LacI family DNA-binding transcriptional regulator [Spirochaetales bacterium]
MSDGRKKKITVDDLVRHSGVSRSSVFRYFQGKPLKPALKEALETAISHLEGAGPRSGLGQKLVQEVLVSMAPGGAKFAGFAQVVDGLMERLAEVGGKVRLVSGTDLPTERTSGAGVVILGKNLAEEEAEATQLEAAGIPFVLINRLLPHSRWSSVGIDNRRAAAEVVGLLLDRGHRRIGLSAEGSEVNRNVADKVLGFQDAFTARNLPVPGEFGGLGGPERPTAWFAFDDEAAIQIIRDAQNAGLRVPQDLAVLGFNDLESGLYASPSLSTVHVPFRRFGTDAVEVLNALMADPGRKSIQWVLKHQLIERESTGPHTKNQGE